ncbi:DUF2798 domain-containing protein [Marinicellulosiphila megalodicopiae]|uniref:DUF2798 domain-containing protein n=1 Tax=Marinicellulosiphila megalodicopiae TaxID=2724896 RepID=UPI003BAFA170
MNQSSQTEPSATSTFNSNSSSQPIKNKRKKTPLLYKIMVIISIVTVMAGSLTGIMTLVNLGYTDLFFINWLTSFALAVCFLVPSGFILMTANSYIVGKLLPNLSTFKKNLVVGVMMAIMMESIMAATTAASNIGFSDINLYADAWLNGFLTALPIGILLSVVMTITIKPKLEKFMAS